MIGRWRRFKPSEYMPVIHAVCAEHGVAVPDVLSANRGKRLFLARKAISLRLREIGMPLTQIANALNRDVTTINYYVYPARQERERRRVEARAAARGPRKPKPTAPIPCRFAPDVMEWIEAQARAEQVAPEVIIRERMRELAEHERAAREVA